MDQADGSGDRRSFKIVIVISSAAREHGGTAYFVRDLSAQLAVRGHEVTVVTHAPEPLSPGVKLVETGPTLGRFALTRGLRKMITEACADADVVLVQGLWQHMSLAAVRVARRLDIPYFVFTHGMLDPYIMNRTPMHSVVRRTQLSLYQGRHLREADGVIFTTQAELDKGVRTIPDLANNAVLIRYGTPDPQVPDSLRPNDGTCMTVGYLGRLHPKKNLGAAIAALSETQLSDVHLDIVGPPSAHMADLQAIVADLALEGRVRFLPPVYDAERFLTLRDWDWLILPSFQENFGQVLSEALSVRTPVIVSTEIDTCETIVHAGAGIPTGTSSSSIAAALERGRSILRSDAYELWRANARRCYEENYSFERTVIDIESLIDAEVPSFDSAAIRRGALSMKLVFATPTIASEAGGPAFFVRDLAAAMSERGYDVSVVTYAPEDAAAKGAAPWRLVPTAVPRGRFGWTRRLHHRLADEFADADVVIIHCIWQQMAMAAAREARRARIPYVMFPHGMLDPYIINRTRFRAVARWVQLRLYQARDLRGAAAVVFTSGREMEKALTVVPELTAIAKRIRYGTVDPEIEPRFEIVDREGSNGPMTIGYLGRLHPKKNLLAAVRAMTAFSSDEVRFEIVGPPSDHLAELQAAVAELGLWDRVSFHPPVFDDQKFVLMRRWDWLILPSFQENFGQVLAQALSVGTPVIVSERIDTCDLVVSVGAGIACGIPSDGIRASVRQARTDMLSDGYLERRRSARAAFDENFSFSQAVDDAVDLLDRLAR